MAREKKEEECRQFATEFEKRLDKIIDRRRIPKVGFMEAPSENQNGAYKIQASKM